MQIVRYIPARTEIIHVNWVKKDWMPMSQRFREIRSQIRKGNWDACFMCHHKFIDGEMMGLANTNQANKVLCAGCCDEIERKEN